MIQWYSPDDTELAKKFPGLSCKDSSLPTNAKFGVLKDRYPDYGYEIIDFEMTITIFQGAAYLYIKQGDSPVSQLLATSSSTKIVRGTEYYLISDSFEVVLRAVTTPNTETSP